MPEGLGGGGRRTRILLDVSSARMLSCVRRGRPSQRSPKAAPAPNWAGGLREHPRRKWVGLQGLVRAHARGAEDQ